MFMALLCSIKTFQKSLNRLESLMIHKELPRCNGTQVCFGIQLHHGES